MLGSREINEAVEHWPNPIPSILAPKPCDKLGASFISNHCHRWVDGCKKVHKKNPLQRRRQSPSPLQRQPRNQAPKRKHPRRKKHLQKNLQRPRPRKHPKSQSLRRSQQPRKLPRRRNPRPRKRLQKRQNQRLRPPVLSRGRSRPSIAFRSPWKSLKRKTQNSRTRSRP